MMASVDIIVPIRDAFVAEARGAPSLFADLAKMELYIAESYRTRALIELLQNADDAGAGVVRIFGDDVRVSVMNDGRPFTAADVEALCRSGASTKQRGAGNIGYRGIGFKSVAGLAEEIAVLSGPLAFSYSKTITRAVLGLTTDVPLIRIPHPLHGEAAAALSILASSHEHVRGTLFHLAGLDLRALREEVEDLSADVLIFLNSVRRIEIRIGEYARIITRDVMPRGSLSTVETIAEGDDRTEWLMQRSEGCEHLALRLDGGVIVPVPHERAVVHAFLPTHEYAGALVKLNGDFSTDPSRKAVDLDSTSESALKVCADLLWQLAQSATSTGELEGLFSVFRAAPAPGGRVAALMKKMLVAKLAEVGLPLPEETKSATTENLRLAPNWLNYADYEGLCKGNYRPISSELLARHPALPDALRWLDAKTLTLHEALNCTASNPPSPMACAQLWARMAKQMRFDLTTNTQQWLASLPILPLKSGNVAPAGYAGEPLAVEFLSMLLAEADADDIRFMTRKLGGELLARWFKKPADSQPTISTSVDRSAQPASSSAAAPAVPQRTPAIQYWRSAEKNAAAWFTVQPGVVSVRDVSQANVGYDLLVAYADGRQIHVEVKAVKRMGEPFRLTNNEHATAYQEGEDYVLAIVVNAEPFEICLISDPIRRLQLEKRCEQWSWYAEKYDELIHLQ